MVFVNLLHKIMNLTALSYKSLQQLAKENNIKAKQKKDVLLAELDKIMSKPHQDDNKAVKETPRIIHNKTAKVQVRQLNNATSKKLAGRKINTIKVDKTTSTSKYVKPDMSRLVEGISKIPDSHILRTNNTEVEFIYQNVPHKIVILDHCIHLYVDYELSKGSLKVDENTKIEAIQIKSIFEIPVINQYEYHFSRVQVITEDKKPSEITEHRDINYWLRQVKLVWYTDHQQKILHNFLVKETKEVTDTDRKNYVIGKKDKLGRTKLHFKFSDYPKKEISFKVAYEWLFPGDNLLIFKTDTTARNPLRYAISKLLGYNKTLKPINDEDESALASCMILNYKNKEKTISIDGNTYLIDLDVNNDRKIEPKIKGTLEHSVINTSYGIIVSQRPKREKINLDDLSDEQREKLENKRKEKIDNNRKTYKKRQHQSLVKKHFAIANIRHNRHLLEKDSNLTYDGIIELKSDDKYLNSTLIFQSPGLFYKWNSKRGKSKLDSSIVTFLHKNNIKDHNSRIIGVISFYKQSNINPDTNVVNVGVLVRKKDNIMFLLFDAFKEVSSVLYFLSCHGMRDKQPLCIGKVYVDWQRILPEFKDKLEVPAIANHLKKTRAEMLDAYDKYGIRSRLDKNTSKLWMLAILQSRCYLFGFYLIWLMFSDKPKMTHYDMAIELFKYEMENKLLGNFAYNKPYKITE